MASSVDNMRNGTGLCPGHPRLAPLHGETGPEHVRVTLSHTEAPGRQWLLLQRGRCSSRHPLCVRPAPSGPRRPQTHTVRPRPLAPTHRGPFWRWPQARSPSSAPDRHRRGRGQPGRSAPTARSAPGDRGALHLGSPGPRPRLSSRRQRQAQSELQSTQPRGRPGHGQHRNTRAPRPSSPQEATAPAHGAHQVPQGSRRGLWAAGPKPGEGGPSDVAGCRGDHFGGCTHTLRPDGGPTQDGAHPARLPRAAFCAERPRPRAVALPRDG